MVATAAYAGTIEDQIALQDILLLEQRDRLDQIGLLTGTSPLPIRVHSNYIPIVFQNNTGLPAAQVYVTFQGINAANQGSQQFMTFDPKTSLGSFVTPSGNLLSANYSVQLSNVPQVQGLPGSYLFYIPLTISGRVYVTLNQPLFVAVSGTSPFSVLDPFVTKYSDPNYYTIYDKWEFTFISSGQSAPNLEWQGNINTSGVDFFGISSEIEFLSYPSGNLLQTFDPTQVNDGPTSFSKGRQTLLTTFVTGLTTANNAVAWSKLALPFLSDPYNALSSTPTHLRILNPGFSIQNPPDSYGGSVPFFQNPTAGFPSDYLQNAVTYGENYIDKWFGYYNSTGRSLTINQDIIANPFTYSGTSAGASPTQTFTLTATSQPTETLAQASVTSTQFFTGASFPFIPANTVLSEFVGGTFEVGLFNTTTVPIISQANLRAHAGTYYSNPPFMSTAGPWYDLYAQLLHSQGLVPSYSTTNVGAVYASPYDDLLGINSSIAVKNPTNYVTVPNPYVNIILNGGNTIPSITDSGTISVTFQLSVPSSTIQYRAGNSGQYISISSGVPVNISSFPLEVAYVSGNSSGVTRYYTIYLKYQNIQPTISPATQYNSSDQGIVQTTTIFPTDASASNFTITFVQ
jgi:hypothetical protein